MYRVLFTTPELKINKQQEQEPQVHNSILVSSTPIPIVENISCTPDEAILQDGEIMSPK